eukprot:gb/GECG01002062.1/.p1 GENE.gb/GECG01002062.1/~~gb/GECG01002062.1/.p1  ORF type:complete len:176 (+),score=24.47 gb/GECG01002062.1/:1-528(+)
MGTSPSKQSGTENQSVDMRHKTKTFEAVQNRSPPATQASSRALGHRSSSARSSGAPMSVSEPGVSRKPQSEPRKAATANKKLSPVATRRRARSTDQDSKQPDKEEALLMLAENNRAISQSENLSSASYLSKKATAAVQSKTASSKANAWKATIKKTGRCKKATRIGRGRDYLHRI